MPTFKLTEGTKGVSVLFRGKGVSPAAIVFVPGRDSEDSVKAITKQLAEQGLTPKDSMSVVYMGGYWAPFVKEPTPRQRLGLKPTWKVA